MARGLGLSVILSLQAEPPAGEPTRCPLPDAGAARAWNVLAPMFSGDGGVMFELYNEPGVAAVLGGWIQFGGRGERMYPGGSCQAVGMQALIDDIRTEAPDNVIIVPGLTGEQSLAGRMSLFDPAHRGDPQLAYGIHYPSMTRGISAWDKAFGTASGSVPVIVTEWDANSTTNCVPSAPATSQLLLDYLESKQMGSWDLRLISPARSSPTRRTRRPATAASPAAWPGEDPDSSCSPITPPRPGRRRFAA